MEIITINGKFIGEFYVGHNKLKLVAHLLIHNGKLIILLFIEKHLILGVNKWTLILRKEWIV